MVLWDLNNSDSSSSEEEELEPAPGPAPEPAPGPAPEPGLAPEPAPEHPESTDSAAQDAQSTTYQLFELAQYIKQCGGSATALSGWSCNMHWRHTGDMAGQNYFHFHNVEGRTFRSRKEVARFLGLQPAKASKAKDSSVEECTWVQCDSCSKWRRLPADAAAGLPDL